MVLYKEKKIELEILEMPALETKLH